MLDGHYVDGYILPTITKVPPRAIDAGPLVLTAGLACMLKQGAWYLFGASSVAWVLLLCAGVVCSVRRSSIYCLSSRFATHGFWASGVPGCPTCRGVGMFIGRRDWLAM